MFKRLKNKLNEVREYWAIRSTGLFDCQYYWKNNLDVARNCIDPITHYIRQGRYEGRKPNAFFDTQWYLRTYPDVAEIGMNPFLHYIKYAKEEDREPNNPKDYFDPEWYLDEYPDVAQANSDPWEHYLEHGWVEGRFPNPYFKPELYLKNNPEVSKLKCNPFLHYLKYGWQKDATVWTQTLHSKDVPEYCYQYIQEFDDDHIREEISRWEKLPLVSVIMPVYNVDPLWLKKAVQSLKNQLYPQWELCITDDCSTDLELLRMLRKLAKHPKIHVCFLKKNLGISEASNAALERASGEYIALMDNDDELTKDALFEMVRAALMENADFLYSDEDKITLEGAHCHPHYKPDWSPDLLLSQNYICHLVLFHKKLLEKTGFFNEQFDGAQDYDLVLRLTETARKILHIPKVLYHWRMIPGSTAAEFGHKSYAQDAGRSALEAAIKRRKIAAEVKDGQCPGTYRVNRVIEGFPLVSIIIPFKDKSDLLQTCLESILEKTTHQNFEILGINNASQENSTYICMDKFIKRDRRVSFLDWNKPFNFSKINNYAVGCANGEHLVLLNNDIEVITPDWIEALLQHSQRKEVGAVGAKLYYPDDTVQHAGVICGIGGVAGHSHKYLPRINNGYFSRPHLIQNLSAVTAACLMVKRSLYNEVGGLNGSDLSVAFNDIDFCLRLRESGYLNIYTPYCQMYHHESISRGTENSEDKIRRFQKEISYMKEKHPRILNRDPYYNPNLTLVREDFSFANNEMKSSIP